MAARSANLMRGRTVGLLGGSFDPPHLGHVRITLEALRQFRLDRVWWLVSPGNPLKPQGPAALDRRLAAARAIMQHPRVSISNFEAEQGTRYTAQTLRALMGQFPHTRFVWLMGADNLVQFHQWQDWRWIMENIPIGVLARPGQRVSARTSVAANQYERFRLRGRQCRLLARSEPPAWCFVNLPMVDLSSTSIRAAGGWHR